MILIDTTQNRAENALIKVLDSKGNELHLITNRFYLSADETAELYKSRLAHWVVFQMDEAALEYQEVLRTKRTSCA